MWEFYLACSEMAFRESDMVVFQIQLAKRKGVTPAPATISRARKRGCACANAAPLRRCGWPANSPTVVAESCRQGGSGNYQRSLGHTVSNGDSRKHDFPTRHRSINHDTCVVACGCGECRRRRVIRDVESPKIV